MGVYAKCVTNKKFGIGGIHCHCCRPKRSKARQAFIRAAKRAEKTKTIQTEMKYWEAA